MNAHDRRFHYWLRRWQDAMRAQGAPLSSPGQGTAPTSSHPGGGTAAWEPGEPGPGVENGEQLTLA